MDDAQPIELPWDLLPPTWWGWSSVQRRVFLTYLAGLTGAAVLDSGSAAASLSEAELLATRQATTDLAHANLDRTPMAAYRLLIRHAAQLADDVKHATTPTLRDGLVSIRAETLGHAGAVAGLTFGYPGQGAGHLDDAIGDAENVGAWPLRAWLLGRRAKLSTYAGAHDDAALALLGARQAPKLDAVTGAWLDAQLGEAYGLCGQDRACMATLDRASEGIERAAGYRPPSWIGTFSQARLAGYTGICELRAGRVQRAETALLAALEGDSYPDVVAIDLADCYQAMGGVEQASLVAARVLPLVAASPSRLARDRFRAMLARLVVRYPHVTAVTELDERARAARLIG